MRAIVTMSGGFKGIFIHGVLIGFERSGFRADAYFSCSSSSLPCAMAAVGKAQQLPLEYWHELDRRFSMPGETISDAVCEGIDRWLGELRGIFETTAPRFAAACTFVKTSEAAEITQSERHYNLGRRLLVQGARHDTSWMECHLERCLWDTRTPNDDARITEVNVRDVLYGTTRMLHAWHTPAWINGKPHIDGAYTCSCPVEYAIDAGYDEIIVIGNEPGHLSIDMFTERTVDDATRGKPVHTIQPEFDLKTIDVDVMRGTPQGMERVFSYGIELGLSFVNNFYRFR